MENYPLDEATINFFAMWKARQSEAQARMNGAFELFLLQHKLQGTWRLAENGRELECVAETPQGQEA